MMVGYNADLYSIFTKGEKVECEVVGAYNYSVVGDFYQIFNT